MIQMGALFLQSMVHCRPNQSVPLKMATSELPDQMAIHSAAIAGRTKIVWLLLEADHFRDHCNQSRTRAMSSAGR